MKRVRVWLISVLLILLCFVFGCTSLYNDKEDTALTTLNTTTSSTTSESHSTTQTTTTQTTTTQTTTTLTTVDTTVSNTTSASRTTSPRTTSHGGSVAHEKFESVEELFDWIHNGKGIASWFRGAIQGLKLDHLLIIEAADDTFTLEYIRTFQRGSGWDAHIEYYFTNKKGERVWLYMSLMDMHAPVDDIKKHVKSNILDNENLKHFNFSYKDISMPTTINATTTTTAATSGENDKEDTSAIDVGDYSSEG